MSHMVIALFAGVFALIIGMLAGYYLGKPTVVAPAGGILGTIQSLTGIKL